ncbi:MAG: 2Fe-2S iron-sulfur cluster-binding protein [Hydrogenothermaceae bacterium]
MEYVKVKIDGEEIEVPKGTTILEAAKKLNKLIPTFCYHEKLPIFGGCRICLVYDVKMKRSIIACGNYVYDGMEIETENEQVKNDRKFILEMLFTRHPLDCPICDKAGECDLQNWGTYWGPQNSVLPITPFEKIRPEEDWESDYLEYVSNRCVLCIKCVSVCDNINKSHSLFQLERAFETLIAPVTKPMDTSNCEMCGLCVDICPVGAILFKPFKFNARPWLLKETYTHCGFCSLNCPVVVNHDDKKVYRIRSTAELESCAKVYLGYDCFNTNRLNNIKLKGENISIEKAVQTLKQLLESPKTAIVLSGYLSSSTLDVLSDIKEKSNAIFTSDITLTILPLFDGYRKDYEVFEFEKIKEFKDIYVIGDDITDTVPVLTYYLPNGITFIGENPDRIKKLYPNTVKISGKQIIEYVRENVNPDSLIIYSSYFFGEDAYEFGKTLRELEEDKGCKIMLVPPQPNCFGLINRFWNDLEVLTSVIDRIDKGEIENLILFGEEVVSVIDELKFKELWDKVRFKVIFTPFEDGLTFISDLSIPMNTWIEEDSYFEGARGERRIKKSLKNNNLFSVVVENLSKTLSTEREKRETVRDYTVKDFINVSSQKIYDASYFSLRSKNLKNWKEKLISEVVNEY